MKQILHKACLTMLLFVVGVCSTWADEVTFTFNTDAGISALGIAKPEASAGTDLTNTSYTNGDISMTITHGGTNTRVWNSNGSIDLRVYKNGTLTFTGATITKVALAGGATTGFSTTNGTFSSSTWTGSATSVALTATGTGKINTITVTYSKNDTPDPDDGGGSGDGGDDAGNNGNDGETCVYKKVASQSDITNGVYLIVCESENTAMGGQSPNSRRFNANVTISNNTIELGEVNAEGKPYEVTITNEGEYYTMVLSNGYYLGNGAKGSNYLKEVQSYAAGYGWSLTYTSGSVTMKTNHAEAQRYLCVNTANADSYATYSAIGSYGKVTLYKKQAPAVIDFIAADTKTKAYYTTYSNTKAVTIPEMIEIDGEYAQLSAYTISVVDGAMSLKKVEPYDNVIYLSENEGYMIKAEYSDDVSYTGNVAISVPYEELNYDLNSHEDDNVLRPTGNGITAAEMEEADANCLYYRLTMHNGTQIGYWWGAANGAAFAVAANKAYAAVPNNVASNLRLWFNEDTLTDINSIETTTDCAIYNLQGQRIQRLQQGVNIINGRKVIR